MIYTVYMADAQITVLGSGTCVSSFYKPFDYLAPATYLLQHNNHNILLDCSEGVRARLESLRVDYHSIDTIIITHFHPDHFNVETFLQSVFVRESYKKTNKSIKIFGPPGIKENLEIIWNIKHGQNQFEQMLLKTINLEFYEYEDGKELKVNDIILTPYVVNHVKGLTCFSVRLKINNKILTYSGDTGMCEGIKKAALNADMLISECNTTIDGQIVSFHLRADEAARIACKAAVKTLVLSHLRGVDQKANIINVVKKTGFSGNIIIASDNKKISL